MTATLPERIRVERLRRPSIPLADANELRGANRRTAVMRIGLAAALVGLLAGCLLLALDLKAPPSSYYAAGAGGIIVIDLSSSIDPARYRRMHRVLNSFAQTDQPTGLVAFSDTAYEVMPPGTRGSELKALTRFFKIPERRQSDNFFSPTAFRFPPSPWSGSFRGGTRISTGLVVARNMIKRDGIENGAVLLVSDLDDSPFDTPKLAKEIGRYEREGIEIRVVPLFPAPNDREVFSRLLGPDAFLANKELLSNASLRERRTLVGSFPLALVAASAALLILLAINEQVGTRLAWRRGRLV